MTLELIRGPGCKIILCFLISLLPLLFEVCLFLNQVHQKFILSPHSFCEAARPSGLCFLSVKFFFQCIISSHAKKIIRLLKVAPSMSPDISRYFLPCFPLLTVPDKRCVPLHTL